MPLSNLNELSDDYPNDPASYSGRLRALMEQLEGKNKPEGAYFDTVGKITIGVGFNLDAFASRTAVMEAMNLTLAQIDAVNAAFNPLTPSPQLTAIRALAQGPARDAQLRTFLNGLLGSRTFLMSTAEVDDAFARLVVIHSKVPAALIPTLSFERMALVSMDFNKPGLIGDGLKAAFNPLIFPDPYEARAEAWYQIRYDHKDQLHKRRYVEAALFGLYGTNVPADDAAQAAQALGIYRVYTRRAHEMTDSGTAMVAYDKVHAAQIAEAQLELNAAHLDVIHVEVLRATLDPALRALIAWLNPQLPADGRLTASAWNSAAIYVGPSGSNPAYLDASVDDGRGDGMQNNLLIGGAGSDNLFGGEGDDVLVGLDDIDRLRGEAGVDHIYGGDGSDYIEGGRGDDFLYGGEGRDTYVWNAGDGADTIVDAEGGRLIINGNTYTFSVGQMVKDKDANIWRDATGNVVLTHQSPWRIELSDGSVIQLGADFDPTEWGIALRDARADHTYQPIAQTITGDMEEADSSDSINGTQGADLIQGLGGSDALHGNGGDDRIEGGAGLDRAFGDAGFDRLYGGVGNDYLDGGADNDELFGEAGQDVLHGRAGEDILAGGQDADISLGEDGNDELYADDKIDLAAAVSQGEVEAGSGLKGDWLDGGAGEDILVGGTGDDLVTGGDGADVIVAGAGDDNVYGDFSLDFAFLDWSVTRELNGSGSAINFQLNFHRSGVLAGIEGGNDEIYGGAGSDWLNGGLGDDLLDGGAGNDILIGGDGSDQLQGDGETEFVAGADHGSDYLDGGAGRASRALSGCWARPSSATGAQRRRFRARRNAEVRFDAPPVQSLRQGFSGLTL